MMNTLLIFFGAGLGGVLRFWVSTSVHQILSKDFPFGTLIVNVTGSFIMGVLFILLIERIDGFGSEWRAFLLIGLLGGYTTFSSFSMETINLFENGAYTSALLNIFGSMLLCLGATWIGVLLGRQI